MINFPELVKNKYKDYNREIKVVGNLYIANKRISKNLFNYNAFENSDTNIIKDTSIKGFKVKASLYACNTNLKLKDFCPELEIGETYYLSGITTSPNAKYIYVGEVWAYGETKVITQSMLDNDVLLYGIYPEGAGSESDYIEISNIQIIKGSEPLKSYEEYGTIVNDYNVLNSQSNNLLNAKVYFSNYYENNIYKFEKQNYYYIETNSIDINELNIETEKNYIFSLNIISNYNNLDEMISVVGFNENNEYIYEANSDLSKIGIQKVNFNLPSNTKKIILRVNRSTSLETNTLIVNNMQIVEGNINIPYEEYNTTPFRLTEENECKILGFNINEKTDIYMTSLPGNTMTLEVDNEKGYFTDYDENSIIDELNNECYVDLFMKNDTDYYKIVTMNFDKISFSDYHTAKLNFYSYLSKSSQYSLKDKNKQFNKKRWNFQDFQNYIKDNYNISAINTHPFYQTRPNAIFISINTEYERFNNLKDFCLVCNTSHMGGVQGQGAMLINNRNNDVCFKAFSNISLETITKDMQLEKAIIKKENTYKNLKFDYYDELSPTYEQTTETYSKTIRNKLYAKRDVLIYIDNDYRIRDISINDITVTGNVTLTLGENTGNINGLLIFIVEGNIGENYAIEINKSNIYKFTPQNLTTWNMTGDEEETKTLKIIQNKSPLHYDYFAFLFIKKPIKSYVETKIMGLPYLEIGDTVEIEIENRNVKIVITEIDTNYDEGLIQTIKGYELDWTHQVPTTQYSGIYSDLNNWT